MNLVFNTSRHALETRRTSLLLALSLRDFNGKPGTKSTGSMPKYRHRVYPLVNWIFAQKLDDRSDRFPHWGDRVPRGRISF